MHGQLTSITDGQVALDASIIISHMVDQLFEAGLTYRNIRLTTTSTDNYAAVVMGSTENALDDGYGHVLTLVDDDDFFLQVYSSHKRSAPSCDPGSSVLFSNIAGDDSGRYLVDSEQSVI